MKRHSSKSERNLIILQVNMNGIKNNFEELKLLIHDTHADIITIQETKLTPKANTPNVHNFITVRADKLHKAWGGLITLIRDNIIFTSSNYTYTKSTPNHINHHYATSHCWPDGWRSWLVDYKREYRPPH